MDEGILDKRKQGIRNSWKVPRQRKAPVTTRGFEFFCPTRSSINRPQNTLFVFASLKVVLRWRRSTTNVFGNYGAVTRDVVTEFDHVGCEMNGNNEQFHFPNEKKNHT